MASIPYWNIDHDTAVVLANRRDVNEVSPWIYGLSASGAIVPQYPPGQAAAVTADIARLRAAHLRIVPSIANVTGGGWAYQPVARMLHSPALAKEQVAAIVAMVDRQRYAGIDIDYEELHAADRTAYTQFVTELAKALHAHGKILSVAVFPQAAAPQGRQPGLVPGLRRARRGRRSGPDHGLQLPLGDVRARCHRPDRLGALGAALRHRRQMPSSKVVLGIPLFGYDWPDGSGAAQTVSWLQALRLSRQYHVAAQYARPVRRRTSATSPRATTHTVWFENAASSKAKFEAVQGTGIAGVYLWMYGYEDPATWSALHSALPTSGPGASSTSKAVP